MATNGTETARALYGTLTPFHEVSGLILRGSSAVYEQGALDRIDLNFDDRTLSLSANEADDTLNIELGGAPALGIEKHNALETLKPFVGQSFGWGWVTINQQGYLDGSLISFDGITPNVLIQVVASVLKITIIG